MPMWFFALIFTAVWAVAHLFLAHRLGQGLAPRKRRLLWGIFALHFGWGLLATAMRSAPHLEPLYSMVKWTYYLGMGAFSILFVAVLIKELPFFVHWFSKRFTAADGQLADPSRRDFFHLSANMGVVAATAGATSWGFYQARRAPDLVEVTVPLADLPPELEGFRIVQLSDIHVGPTIRRRDVQMIVDRVNQLQVDLVAITGDLIEGDPEHILDDLAPIFDLQSLHGTYFCTGNHEYYWDGPKWAQILADKGLHILLNQHRVIHHQGGRLVVAGCTDLQGGHFHEDHHTDPQAALADAPEYDASILLAHQPGSIFEAAQAGYDLQLSGHTHGGQFWPGNLIVGLVHPYSAGLDREDKTWIYVSRGTGYWGPPMRLKAPSEITLLTLVNGPPDRADSRRRPAP